MALLNNTYPYIFTQIPGPKCLPPYIRYSTDSFVMRLRNFDDGNDYYYMELFCGNAFDHYNIRDIVPPDILHTVCNDEKTFLYIVNSHEAFTDILIYPLYEALVIKENIPAHKVIIANEAADLYITARECAEHHNLGCFKTEWIRVFESHTSLEARMMQYKTNDILSIDHNYDKRFLSFNRRWRSHRPLLVALLKAMNLLDKGHVSLGLCDDNHTWKDFYPMMRFHHEVDARTTEILEKFEDEIINLPPMYLDYDDLTVNLPEIRHQSLPFYRETVVSLVGETNYFNKVTFNSSRFLSEKIFKPIGIGHPFILVSVPRSLELLRTLGYKTFHPYIDESYDLETEDYERMYKILNEVRKICEYTPEELKEFINNVKPIVEYNKQLLISKNDPNDPSTMAKNFIGPYVHQS